MWINIRPVDTLFFRSGRPFTMGDDYWTDVVFPPNPSTFYGAIRSYLLLHRGDLKKFIEGYPDIGSFEKKGGLKIVGPLLCEESSGDQTNIFVYFPVPRDMVALNGEAALLKMEKLPRIFITDSEVLSEGKVEQILLDKSEKPSKEAYGYITEFDFVDYLSAKNRTYRVITEDRLIQIETKIGIARDRVTKASKEGFIYQVPLIRLNKGFSFLLKIENAEGMPDEDFMALGGEGRTAHFRKIDSDIEGRLEPIDFELRDGVFKIFLATPAIFEQGWLPVWINNDTFEGEKNGIKLKLVACCIGPYLRIGGWDIAKNRPKPSYKAVPAGSVYYFKVLDSSNEEEILKAFQFKCVSDFLPEEGYGLCLVGAVQS